MIAVQPLRSYARRSAGVTHRNGGNGNGSPDAFVNGDKIALPEPLRVLITGGAGFIGSHLAESLIARGASVTAIDDLSTGRTSNIAHLEEHPGFRFVYESVTT